MHRSYSAGCEGSAVLGTTGGDENVITGKQACKVKQNQLLWLYVRSSHPAFLLLCCCYASLQFNRGDEVRLPAAYSITIHKVYSDCYQCHASRMDPSVADNTLTAKVLPSQPALWL